MSLKIIAIIPARYQATRFPAKLMQDLCGKSVIVRTYEATTATGLFDQVLVATDSEIIYDEIVKNHGVAVMSKKDHDCGSDRIAEAVEFIDADIVINVQGDEPFTNKRDLEKLIDVFKSDLDKSIALASLMHEIKDNEAIQNPNNVKVITDQDHNALFFSRSPIPYNRDSSINTTYYKHIGIYAFRKTALLDFYKSIPTPLERKEKIECLRYLEHGKQIKMVITDQLSIGIDSPKDLEEAIKLWKELNH